MADLIPAGAILMCIDSGLTSMLTVGSTYVCERSVLSRSGRDVIVWLNVGCVTFGSRFVRVSP